jgi:hypothetical protein
MHNSTVADNYAGEIAGGIFATKDLLITHSTISGNSGGILCATLFMRNTLVADNYGTGTWQEVNCQVQSGDHNIVGGDAKLGPLADNGGPTHTMALLPGSPAIDAGDNFKAPEWDQRGSGFPRIVNGTIDIGAFEVQATGMPGSTHDLAVLMTADFGDPKIKARRLR